MYSKDSSSKDYLKRTSNYSERIIFFYPTYMMNVADLMAIGMETPRMIVGAL